MSEEGIMSFSPLRIHFSFQNLFSPNERISILLFLISLQDVVLVRVIMKMGSNLNIHG